MIERWASINRRTLVWISDTAGLLVNIEQYSFVYPQVPLNDLQVCEQPTYKIVRTMRILFRLGDMVSNKT